MKESKDVSRPQYTNETIKEAVNLWCENRPAALEEYGPINDWDTSRVTNMRELFYNKYEFNEDISRWNVGAVKDMFGMFKNAFSFNQPLGEWNVGAVTSMNSMFECASSFNQFIGGWNVKAVTHSYKTFSKCPMFNKNKPPNMQSICCVHYCNLFFAWF